MTLDLTVQAAQRASRTPRRRRIGERALRLVRYLGLGLAALVGIFLAVAVLPGDAASQRLGLGATPEALEELRAEMGLGAPPILRFAEWAGDALRGDWGTSAATGAPVADLLLGPLGRSLAITICVLVGVSIVGIGGGILAGSRTGGRLDKVFSSAALAAICTPEFVLGTALVFVFATSFGWLPAVSTIPAGGSIVDRPEALVLPALTITLVGGATLLRQVRAVIAAQADRPHIEAATLSGFHPAYVVVRHMVPGALPAIAQASALIVPYVVGGAVVVERVFGFPGIGSVLVGAIANRDIDVVMGASFVLVLVSVFGYAVADQLGRERR